MSASTRGVAVFVGNVAEALDAVRRSVGAHWSGRITVVAVLIGLGLAMLDDNEQLIVVTALIYSIAAIALSVLMGWVGRPSLMTAGSLLAGGYATVYVDGNLGLPFPLVLVAVTLIGGAFGLLASLPARRLSGLYLLLSTMAVFYLITDVGNIIQSEHNVLGGYFIEPPTISDTIVTQGATWFVLVALITFAVLEYFNYLRRTRIGRGWIAIRDHEAAASVTGVRVGGSVALAFALTTAAQFLAGSLFAYHLSTVSYTSYPLHMSINFIIMVVIGGLGRTTGAVVGAAIVTLVPSFMNSTFGDATTSDTWITRNLGALESIVFALIGIAVLLNLRARIMRRRAEVPPGATEPTGTGPRIELRNVTASYAAGETALDKVNLTVHAGTTVAVVGRNGAGKSSLLHALSGFPEKSGGRVVAGDVRVHAEAGDTDLRPLSISERSDRGIALIPAEDKIFAELTVREHLRDAIAAGTARAKRTGAEPPTLERILATFSALDGKLDRKAGLLSGGERQQVALAAALARQPYLLLIDEPTLGLSPVAIEGLEPILDEIGGSVPGGVVLAEQNPALAMRLSDTIVLLEGGRIVRACAPDDNVLEFIEERFLGLHALVENEHDKPADSIRDHGVHS